MNLEAAHHPLEAQPLAVEPDPGELGKTKTVPPALATEPRKASLAITSLDAAEETGEGVVQPLERPALRCHRQTSHLGQIAAADSQCLGLVYERPAFAGLAVAIDALFKSRIV